MSLIEELKANTANTDQINPIRLGSALFYKKNHIMYPKVVKSMPVPTVYKNTFNANT